MRLMPAIFLFYVWSGCALAQEGRLKCLQKGGDALSADGSDRLSPKMELKLTETEATLTGKVWGQALTETGHRTGDQGALAVYRGFERVMDENSDCTLSVEKTLLKGKAGKASVLVKGDGKNSVDLRYEFSCQ